MQFPFPCRKLIGSADFEKPGDMCFVVSHEDEKPVGVGFMCPCGCGEKGVVLFYKEAGRDSWNWNGNSERPTLTPSIQRNTPCRWHGHLTDGMWTL